MPATAPFISVTIIGAEELAANLSRSREYMLGAINRALRRVGDLVTPRMRDATPEGATSHLKDYTVYQILGHAEDQRCEIRQSARSETGFPYGAGVRAGTRPHFPPYRALIPWVIKKLHVVDEKEARTVAFLVARKISKVGTQPNPYHIRVVEASIGDVQQIMKEELVTFLVQIADIPAVTM